MKVLLYANTAWYLYNFRRSLAERLREQGHEVLLASPRDAYAARFAALGLRWVEVPMQRRSVNPLRELALLWWLKALMQRERVDLIHSFTIKCVIYGSIAARMAGVAARVGSAAGLGYVFTRSSLRALALRGVASTMMRIALGGRNMRLIVQNPDDDRFFKQWGLLPQEAVALIPSSGVNCQRFRPRPQARTVPPGGEFRVVLAARLLRDKGVNEFVEAARLVQASGRRVRFLLAGTPDKGNPTSVPENEVRQWEREGLVQWLGHVEDMVGLFHSVDAMALPSYREGLPKGLIEAAACALPLVTTDVPGCREVVEDGVDGLLVPAKDPAALAGAIMSLHDDPQLAARLGAAARQKALSRYDERRVIGATLRVYGEVTESVLGGTVPAAQLRFLPEDAGV
jgi:glycosyltransferase involved in cell wall biosynthesis